MNNLPVELLHAIGTFLDGTSLVAALQVSHHWHHILHSLVWHNLTAKQQRHVSFPLRLRDENSITKASDNQLSLSTRLLQVRRLDWFDTDHVVMDPDLKVEVPRPILAPLVVLGRILRWTANLVSLRVCVGSVEQGILLGLVETIKQLTHLKVLEVHIPVVVGSKSDSTLANDGKSGELVVIEELFPVFSRLERLGLTGAWITGNKQKQEYEPKQSWAIRTLAVDMRLLYLVYYCPNVTRLKAHKYFGRKGTPSSLMHSLHPLSRCLKLEELSLPRMTHALFRLDTPFYIPLLRMIRKLSFPVTKSEDMDFLNLPATLCPAGLNIPPNPQYINRNSTAYETACGSTMVLPMLEHLEIVSSTIGPRENEKFQLALRQFLLSRTRLKVLDLSAISVDPLSVFAQKGMEEKHNWACTDLEVLAFKYSRMNRVYTDYEQHRVLLNSVYRQLRSLTKLRRLSIYCDVAIELHDPGMSQLKGSSELEDMSLVGTRWTREGIVKLLEAVPGLKVLRTYGDKEIVYRWLKDLERPDVKCE